MLTRHTTETERPEITAKKNRSFATPTLTLLEPVIFKNPLPAPKTILFIHPPKTGGTNLHFLTEAIGKTSFTPFNSTRFPVLRILNRSPGLITEGWIGGLASAQAKLQEDPNFCQNFHFISGHFPVGLHTQIQHSNPNANYITLVRNPIEHALSAVNFDNQRGYVAADLEEYLLKISLDNPQTRMLAGVPSMSGSCTIETLETAKKNIATFFLTGVTEDTYGFMQILSSTLGWGPVALAKAQVTGEKALKSTPEITEALAIKHQFDMQLYEWVKARWFAQKAELLQQPNEDTRLYSTEKILCITAEYSNTRKPIFLSRSEIIDYNRKKTEGLVEVSQNHSELKNSTHHHDIPRKSQAAITPHFSLKRATSTGDMVLLKKESCMHARSKTL